jgi:DNA-binding response OmpR family regulator
VTSKTVLIVSDDTEMSALLEVVLHDDLGARVSLAAGANDAVWQATTLQPSLIIIDLGWPATRDLNTIAKLRENKPSAGTPLLALSTSAQVCQIALHAGCADALEKPFDVQDLCDKVKKHL